MNFKQKLSAIWSANDSLLCVGLDPDLARIPSHIKAMEDPIFEFCKQLVDATHDLVCAYKPQIAYFSAASAEPQLVRLMHYIKQTYPHIPLILDAKRGDIGATAEQYAAEAFLRYRADAVTINPYMGYDTIQPFLSYTDKGVIVLCRTSNLGAGDLQDLLLDGVPLYQHIAHLAATKWNEHDNCLLVVGATQAEPLANVRQQVGDMPLLVPGVGAQGGDIAALVKAGQTATGTGLIINSSRAIIYASNGKDFAQSARQSALDTRNLINQYRHA